MRIQVLGFLTCLLVSCSTWSSNGREVTFGVASPPETVDPALAVDSTSLLISSNLYEGLVGYDSEMKVVPVLAESYKISSDDRTYTFYLRRGVKFYDGSDLNASTVLFSFLRQHDENHPFHRYGPYRYWNSSGFRENIEAINELDSYRVEIKLKNRDRVFLQKLTQPFAAILSSTFAEEVKGGLLNRASGTGPYHLEEWQNGDFLVLKKNPNYWNVQKKPLVDTIVFRFIPDARDRYVALMKGEIDIVENPNSKDYKVIEKSAHYQGIEYDVFSEAYLFLNNEISPFNDLKIRKALAHLIDRDEIHKAVSLRAEIVPENPVLSQWNPKNTFFYDYDVEKAKQLLEEGGYTKPIEIKLYYSKKTPWAEDVGLILKRDFAKANVNLDMEVIDSKNLATEMSDLKYKAAILEWSPISKEPGGTLGNLFATTPWKEGGLNMTGFTNSDFDALLRSARQSESEKEASVLYGDARKLFSDNVPAIPLFATSLRYGAKKIIKMPEILPTGRIFLETLSFR